MQVIKRKLFTVAEVAETLGLTPGRIRQICREFEIGTIVGGSRIFDEKDVDKISKLPDRRSSNDKRIGKIS